MSDSGIILSVVVAYLAVNLAVGLWPQRRGTSADAAGYVAGDRSLGLLVMYFITGATIFSAFAFLGMPGWAYERGGAAYYILAYGVLGFIPFYFLGPRASRLGRARGFVTQAEMVAHRFGSRTIAGLMAFVSVAAFVPYLAIQMKGAGYVLNALTDGAVSEELGAGLVYAVVLVYVLQSGVLGVGWTNTLQGIFMMALAWGIGLYLPHVLYGGVGEMFRQVEAARPGFLTSPGLTGPETPWSWAGYSSAVLVSIIGFSFWPHLFMKAFTAKDERTIRRTVVLYPTFQLFLLPLLIIGFSGVLFELPPAQADQIVPHLLLNLELSPFLVGLFCAGALAASMSSGDAMAHAAASIAVRDGLVTAGGLRPAPSGERTLIRAAVVLVMLSSYALAITYQGSLVGLLLLAYGPVTQFAPAVVATLCWRRATGPGVLAGLVVGATTNLLLHFQPEWKPWAVHAGLYGLVLNTLVVVVVSRLTAAQDNRQWFIDAAPRRP